MKNLANFKTAVRSREYLIQAIFQMLFDNQVASKIIVQFKEEHKSKKVDFELFSNSLLSIEENIKNIESIISKLDIKGPNLVKGVNLEGLRVLGDPSYFAKKYYENLLF